MSGLTTDCHPERAPVNEMEAAGMTYFIEANGTASPARTGDPQIHNLVL